MTCDLKYKRGTVTNQEEKLENTSRLRECHVQRLWGGRGWFWKKVIEKSKGEHMPGGRICLELAGLCWAWKVLVFILKGCEQGFMGQAANSLSTPTLPKPIFLPLVEVTSISYTDFIWLMNWICFHCWERCKFLWVKWFAYLKKGNSHSHWMNKCHDLYLVPGATAGPGDEELKEEDRILMPWNSLQWEFQVIREGRGLRGHLSDFPILERRKYLQWKVTLPKAPFMDKTRVRTQVPCKILSSVQHSWIPGPDSWLHTEKTLQYFSYT